MNIIKGAAFVASGLLVLYTIGTADAHRSGCHRWHSCPSDRGTYVCGDLGYSNYCPKKRTQTRTRPAVQAPTAKTPAATPLSTSGPGLAGKNSVMLAQNLLSMLGFNLGPADGVMGSRTRTAIRLFQRQQELKVDGKLSMKLLARMSQVARSKR